MASRPSLRACRRIYRTGLWRYEFGLPFHLDASRQHLWGTHMWVPVRYLKRALARLRLTRNQFALYCERLGNPDKHLDCVAEMAPLQGINDTIPARFEVSGRGNGNRTIDWVLDPPSAAQSSST